MTDRWTIRAVVLALTCLATVCLIGLLGLAMLERPIPEALWGFLGSTAGALGALLARTGSEPEAVRIINTPADPVPTEDAGT